MSKQLSIVVLMFIVAMYGCVASIANLEFQVRTFAVDRDFAMAAYWMSVAIQLISAPLLIRLSDSIGRNTVMTISFAGILVGLVSLLFGNSMVGMSTGFVILGATSTGGGCFNAYFSDQTQHNRAEVFIVSQAAWAVGYVASNVMQEKAYLVNETLLVYIGILITIVGGALTLFVLPKSLQENNRTSFNLKEANMIGASKALFENRRTAMLILSMLLLYIGIRAYSYVQQLFFGTRRGDILEQLNPVLLVIIAFVLIRLIGQKKTAVVTLVIAIAGMVGVLYAPIQLNRITLLLPYVGNIGGAIFLAMVVDKTAPNKYGVIFGGITGLTILTDLVASRNQQLFNYLQATSPQNLFLCAVVPAVILLASLLVFLRVPKTSGEVA